MLKETEVQENEASNPTKIAEALANQMKNATVDNLSSASCPDKTALKEKLEKTHGGTGTGSKNIAQLLIAAEFGLSDAQVTADTRTTKKVTVQIGDDEEQNKQEITVTVERSRSNHNITIEVKGTKVKSKSQARRMAYKLGKALTEVDKVKQKNGGTIPVKITQEPKNGNWTNVLSPFLLFSK